MKKTLCALLCAALLLCVLAACGQDSADASSAASQTSTAGAGSILIDQMGEKNLEGFTLRILSTTENKDGNRAFGTSQFIPDEKEPGMVSDAIMERNNLIEQTFNCKIDVQFTEPNEAFVQKVTNDYIAGDIDYDVVASGISSNGLSALAASGYLEDLNAIENSYLRLDQPWWDQQAVNGLSIDNKLFFINGDLLLTDDERTCMLFFNRDLIEENQLEDPYALVEAGTWTVDKLYEMARAAAVDGGDGKMDVEGGEDTWGLNGAAFDTYKMVLGCNAPKISKNENDMPVITMLDEHNVAAFNKVFAMMSDKNNVAYLESYYRWDDWDNGEKFYNQFYEGRALFYANLIGSLNGQSMQNSSVRFGVLPLPKYDESQNNYACTIDPYHFTCIALPKTGAGNLEKVTFMLEAMAYYNSEKVVDLYYETTLKFKRLNADDSKAEEMLDIIFSNRIIDLANIYNWEDCIQYYNQLLVNNSGPVSFLEARKDALQNAIDETVELFRKLQ